MDILSPEGLRALRVASELADPESLAAAEQLRREFPADLAAAALTQVMLRRRASAKFPRADSMFLTRDGLEQATRHPVARWRAERFLELGVETVYDLGCGIGSDAMAMQEAGLQVQGVEMDPSTAACATANLALVDGRPVLVDAAENVTVPPGAGVFLDPARRGARGRTWRVEDLTPPWSLVERYLASDHPTAVKLGPGFPKELIPGALQAVWVSQRGDVVELCLWNRGPGGNVALVFPRDGASPVEVRDTSTPVRLPVGPVGRFIIEPDNAIIRAGLVASVAGAGTWLLAPGVAYMSSDAPGDPQLTDSFEVVESLPYDTRAVKRWVRANDVGSLEIKARAVDVDPARLRRGLGLRGRASFTLVLARTPDGTRALVTRRVPL